MCATTYIISKIDQHKYCKTNGHFTRHLKTHNLTYSEYYETYITGFTPLCECRKPLTFYQASESYANSCGNPKCVGNSVSSTKQSWSDEQRNADSDAKKEAANNRTPEQIAEQVAKTKETFKKKYGVEWVTASESYKEKSKQTKIERYGDEFWSNSKKASKTRIKKSVEEKNIIADKRRKTNKARYGVENLLLLPGNTRKSNKGNASIKNFTMPSGKIIGVRGYEPQALNILFEQQYDEQGLILHDNYSLPIELPIFEYVNINQHKMKYYPDIYIPAENRIIEIKSQWWWDGNGAEKYKSRLTNNLRKRQAVIDNGYNYEVWIFTNKQEYKVLKDGTDFQTE